MFSEDGVFSWSALKNEIIGKKFEALKHLADCSSTERQIGKAVLYKMLSLLRTADQRINIARFAYLLARITGASRGSKNPNADKLKKTTEMLYSWICSPKERRELITAIYIYVYYMR